MRPTCKSKVESYSRTCTFETWLARIMCVGKISSGPKHNDLCYESTYISCSYHFDESQLL